MEGDAYSEIDRRWQQVSRCLWRKLSAESDNGGVMTDEYCRRQWARRQAIERAGQASCE